MPGEHETERAKERVYGWLVPALAAVIALAFGIITYRLGRIESTDTQTYSDWADILIASDFNYLRMVRSISFVVPSYLYMGWLTVVALFKITLGPAWPAGIVVFNYCLAVLAVWGTLEVVRRTTRSGRCLLVAGALLLIAYDLFNWIRYVLSDISFMAITLALYYLFCLLVFSNGKASSNIFRLSLCIVLMVLALLYRPTGVPLVLVGGLIYLTKRLLGSGSAAERARVALRIAVGYCLLGMTAIFAHAYLMKEPTAWPFSFASKWIEYLSKDYSRGFIVFHRPETYVQSPAMLIDYIFITLKKLGYFFAIYSGSFSATHKAANLAFFLPAYLLAIPALINLFRRNDRLTLAEWWAAWIALVWILSFALFHSVQQVDYDWRYRLPCLLPLIVLSSIGFRSLTSTGKAINKESPAASAQSG